MGSHGAVAYIQVKAMSVVSARPFKALMLHGMQHRNRPTKASDMWLHEDVL